MKARKILIIILVVVAIMFISFSFYVYQMFNTANFLVEQQDRDFYIYTEDTFEDVRNRLYDENYIHDAVSFSLLSKLMKYTENVKPGHYVIEANTTNYEVVKMLRAGEQVPVLITFSNVRLLSELSELVCANIELEPAEFDSLLFGEDTPEKYGFNKDSFRSMFIPNTYEVYWNISAENLLEKFKTEYDKFWNDERLKKADSLNMTPVEVSVMASIVQAETRHNDESPTIAGLYLNRLKRGMLLQADPTLIYAVGDFKIQRVLNVHKEIDSPYNTYKYTGLPPGPINFPSIISIDAVLNNEDHNYLYMCAKEDFSGYHNFTSSLTEHLRNARRFQNALNRARIYQ